MKRLGSLSLCSFVLPFSIVFGATLQSSSGVHIRPQPNVTIATVPSASSDQTLLNDSIRYPVPGSSIVLDFYYYTTMKSIIRVHALMAIVEGLSKICGNSPTDTIPELNTFKYNRLAFVHIQDLNPTVTRHHTYADLATTLRGVGEFMTQYDNFKEMEFQIWAVTSEGRTKIGSGAMGGTTHPSEINEGDTGTS